MTLWGFTVVVFLFLAIAGELFWLSRGYLPCVADSRLFWAMKRSQISCDGGNPIVLVGASRAQLGIVPKVLEEVTGSKVLNLTINGTPSFAVLRDLGNDESFKGTIICSIIPPWFLKKYDSLAQGYVDFYKNDYFQAKNLNPRFNTRVKAFFQSIFCSFSPALTINNIFYSKFNPDKMYLHMNHDRHFAARYEERLQPEKLREHKNKRIARSGDFNTIPTEIEKAEFESVIGHELKVLAEKIHRRGGKLVLIRMPTTGEHWIYDERAYPRSDYWDKLRTVPFVDTIHFMDYPELNKFECPDTSHLEEKDAREFTRALGNMIVRKNDNS